MSTDTGCHVATLIVSLGSIELPYYEVKNISCNADYWSIQFKFLIGSEFELVTLIG